MDDDVETVERDLSRALRAWTVASAVAGTAAAVVGHRTRQPGVRAFGVQTLLWAGVDAAILGAGAAARARAGGPPPRARLRRLLLVNTAADVGYTALGAALVGRPSVVPRRWRRRGGDEALQGHGAAVVVQGLALLVLDARAAARLASR